jgi:uncharacterized membrane protein required for colicin V production
MAFIVDIILVIVLGLCVFFGWKNGFLKAISGFLSYVISFAIANFAWEYLAVYVGKFPFLQKMVTEGVDGPSFEEGATFLDKLQSMMNFFAVDILQNGNTDVSMAVVKNYLAELLTISISFILIFIVCMILFKILFRLLDSLLKKIPVIKQVNGILGAIMGFLNGSVWTWAIANVFVKAFLPMLNQMNPSVFPLEIADSFIITLCTKINPMTYIFQFINWLS